MFIVEVKVAVTLQVAQSDENEKDARKEQFCQAKSYHKCCPNSNAKCQIPQTVQFQKEKAK